MDLEKLQQQIQELQDRTSSLETENESLKKSRAGHLTDLARYKGVNRILKAAGIDPKDEAARIYQQDPKGAQRLYNQAKSAGKLDPHCAKIITP